MEPTKSQTLRCAIYTRKSSEEGLEQDFNSLHAQREACESYIKSQQGEGWRDILRFGPDGHRRCVPEKKRKQLLNVTVSKALLLELIPGGAKFADASC